MKRKPERGGKRAVLKFMPDAYCKKLNDGTGFIVWPGKIQPRGFEQAACGLGKTARQAWASVKLKLYMGHIQ